MHVSGAFCGYQESMLVRVVGGSLWYLRYVLMHVSSACLCNFQVGGGTVCVSGTCLYKSQVRALRVPVPCFRCLPERDLGACLMRVCACLQQTKQEVFWTTEYSVSEAPGSNRQEAPESAPRLIIYIKQLYN